MSTLACYIRLSLADGDLGSGKDESNSISNQRSLLHQYIDTHPEFSGWSVQEFVDAADIIGLKQNPSKWASL